MSTTAASEPRVRRVSRFMAPAEARPRTERWEDAVTVGLALLGLIALYWDGWGHNNSTTIDTFFRPAHIAMYSALSVLGGWIGLVLLRHQPSRKKLTISMSAVPQGYGLALVALPLAALGGPCDYIWHAIYGFENQVDAPWSPTHQMLFLAGTLLACIAMGSAWRQPERAPGFKAMLPTIVSAAAIVAMIEFVFMHTLPFMLGSVPSSDFQNDIARYTDAYGPGTEVQHAEGLAQSVVHYGDQAFPYYLFSNMQAIGGMIIFTVVWIGMSLFLRRRWRLPAGTFTVIAVILALLFPMLTAYREVAPMLALFVTGVVADVLMQRLLGEDPIRISGVRIYAALVPVVLWGAFLVDIAVLQGGLGWNATMFLGVLSTCAGVGYGVSLLVFPPALTAAGEPEAG